MLREYAQHDSWRKILATTGLINLVKKKSRIELLIVAVLVAAQQRVTERLLLGPPAAGPNILSLDFFRTLEYALTHSRDYQSRMEDLYLAALDVTLQRHLFEPRPFATQSFTYTGGQKDLGY